MTQWAFASDLELPPGRWPRQLRYEGCDYIYVSANIRNGEVVSVIYERAADRRRLEIFND